MKEYIAQKDGRFLFSDDLVALNELALSIVTILGKRNFVITGCEVNGESISDGYVYLNGKIRKVDGATFASPISAVFIKVTDTTINEYSADEASIKTPVSVIYGAEVTTEKPTKDYIAYTTEHDFPRLNDEWLENLTFSGKSPFIKVVDKENPNNYSIIGNGSLDIISGDKIFNIKNGNITFNGVFAGNEFTGKKATLNKITTSNLIFDSGISFNGKSFLNNNDKLITFETDKIVSTLDFFAKSINTEGVTIDKDGIFAYKTKIIDDKDVTYKQNYLDWSDGVSLAFQVATKVKNNNFYVTTDNTTKNGIPETLQINSSSILYHTASNDKLTSGLIFNGDDIFFRLSGKDLKLRVIDGLVVLGDSNSTTENNTLTFNKINLNSPTISGGAFYDLKTSSIAGSLVFTTPAKGDAGYITHIDGSAPGLQIFGDLFGGEFGETWTARSLCSRENAGFASRNVAILAGSVNNQCVYLTLCTHKPTAYTSQDEFYSTDDPNVLGRVTKQLAITTETGGNKIVSIDVSNMTYTQPEISNVIKYFPIDILMVHVDGNINLDIKSEFGKQLTIINCQDDSSRSRISVASPYGDDNHHWFNLDGGQARSFINAYKVFDTSSTTKRDGAYSKGLIQYSCVDNGDSQTDI